MITNKDTQVPLNMSELIDNSSASAYLIICTCVQAKIKEFLISACSVIPSQNLQQECDDIANNYLPELLELISEELVS